MNISSAGGAAGAGSAAAAGKGRTSTISSLLGVWALFLAFLLLQIGNGLQRLSLIHI